MKTRVTQQIRRDRAPGHFPRRDGSVLLIVLVVIATLTLACYSFTEIMLSESEASAAFGRDVQARVMADSGVELAAALLGDQSETADANYINNPDQFQAILLYGTEENVPRGRGRFSVVAPVENDTSFTQIRFGLIDESSKLNINALVAAEGEDDNAQQSSSTEASSSGAEEDSVAETLETADTQARDRLMFLPGMTEETADAILDFIDEDDDSREFGAESDYYAGLEFPYEARNKPLGSLEELLLVRDVTPELLYGIDMNRNGILDPSEEAQYGDLAARLGLDESPLGWSSYLTVYSRESNLRADGTARIYLNHDELSELYDQLEEEFDEDTAKFVIAYRVAGPKAEEEAGPSAGPTNSAPSRGGNTPSSSGTQQSTSGGSGSGNKQAELKGGIDISGGSKFTVKSLYDLIGVDVDIEVDKEQTTLTSPWSTDGNELMATLPDLMDRLSASDQDVIEGRININSARAEVLLGIPEIPEELVDKILSQQPIGDDGVPADDTMNLHATTGWVLVQSLTDIETMRTIAPHLTARGDVYQLQAVGYYDEGGPMARIEAVLDASQDPPRVIHQRDLSDLGRGFSQGQLNGLE